LSPSEVPTENNFGDETVLESYYSIENLIRGSLFPGVRGKVLSITARLKFTSGVADSNFKYKFALYKLNNINIGVTVEGTQFLAAGAGSIENWYTLNLVGDLWIGFTDYYIVAWANSTSGDCSLCGSLDGTAGI